MITNLIAFIFWLSNLITRNQNIDVQIIPNFWKVLLKYFQKSVNFALDWLLTIITVYFEYLCHSHTTSAFIYFLALSNFHLKLFISNQHFKTSVFQSICSYLFLTHSYSNLLSSFILCGCIPLKDIVGMITLALGAS